MKVSPLVGVGTFRDTANWYTSALTTDPPVGSTTMSRIVVLRFNRFALITGTVIGHTNAVGGSDGWQLRWQGGAATPRFQVQVADGGSTTRTQTVSFPAAFAPYWLIVMFTYNETELTLRANGVEATDGPFVGFSAATAGGVCIGAESDGGAASPDLAVAAFLGSDSVAMNAAQRAAAEVSIRGDLEQGRAIATGPGFDEAYWDARDVATGPGVTDVSWRDRIGPTRLARNGAPTAFGYSARFE